MRFAMPCLLALLSVACARTPPITRVTILDEHFRLVKVLDAAEVAEFERAWEEKEETDAVSGDAGGLHFKIDIERAGASGNRWLYRSTGVAQVLTMKAGRPVYRLQDPEAFNRLIGAMK